MIEFHHAAARGLLGAVILWSVVFWSAISSKAAEEAPSPSPLEWLKERDLADRSLGGANRFRTHPHLDRALRAMAAGDLERALTSAGTLLRIAPRHRQGLFVALLANHQAGRFQESVAVGQALRELEPDFAPAHLYLGLAWQALGELDAAEAAFGQALALGSLPPEQAWLARLSLAALRDAVSAENGDAGPAAPPPIQQAAKVRKAVPDQAPAPAALSPQPAPPPPPPPASPSPVSLADAGYAALARGDEARAVDLLQRALAGSPPAHQRRQILADLGYLAERRGDRRRAATYFSAALDLYWDTSLAIIQIQLLRELGARSDANQLFERIDPQTLSDAVRLDYLRLGADLNPDTCAAWLDRFAEADGSPTAWYRAGVAWQQEERPARARDSFAKAAVKAPENAQFAAALGYAELTLGDQTRAAAAFEQAHSLDPDNATLIRQLAYLDMDRRRYRRARQRLRRALELEADAGQRRHLQRQLDMLPKPFRFASYTFLRSNELPGFNPAGFNRSLGRSQTSVEIAGAPGALTRLVERRLEFFGRSIWAIDRPTGQTFAETTQAGVGLRFWPLDRQNLSLTAERLIRVGRDARNAWLLRTTYGFEHETGLTIMSRGSGFWAIYLDAALIDPTDPDFFAAGEIRAGQRFQIADRLGLAPFVGINFLGQDESGRFTSLGEAGAGLAMRLNLPGNPALGRSVALDLILQFRGKIAGNAFDTTGFAMTGVIAF